MEDDDHPWSLFEQEEMQQLIEWHEQQGAQRERQEHLSTALGCDGSCRVHPERGQEGEQPVHLRKP